MWRRATPLEAEARAPARDRAWFYQLRIDRVVSAA
jgi:hypothetical protein